MSQELIDKLERNARFYHNESVALAEAPDRRDRRRLGSEEAATISKLLREAADSLRHPAPSAASEGGG